MIQIQIAGGLSEHGVSDICWVLLDPSDPMTIPLPQPVAVAAALATTKPAEQSVPDRRASSRQPATAAGASEAPIGVRQTGHQRPDEWAPGKADLVHQVLRIVILAAALAGAWWLATTKVQSTQSPANPLATSSVAPSATSQLSAQVSRP